MPNYKLIIQYDGTRYQGWQSQKSTTNTIEEKITSVLSKMAGKKITLTASGRTDAGVHALAQVANFHLDMPSSSIVPVDSPDSAETEEPFTDPSKVSSAEPLTKASEISFAEPLTKASEISFEPSFLQNYLNHYLPEDIRILQCSIAGPRFHARFHALRKHYRYCIDNQKTARIFDRKYVWRMQEPLDVHTMQEAIPLLLGEHDFIGFSSAKRGKKSTIRTLFSIDLTNEDGYLTFDFYGNGFLYNMVRILMGTLVEIGLHRIKKEQILEVFRTNDRRLAGMTAPAKGLFLVEVFYD